MWQADQYGISRLWDGGHHLATVFPEGEHFTWRAFLDTLALDDDGDPDVATVEQLEAWGFGGLVPTRTNFPCLEAHAANEDAARSEAEATIVTVRQKAAEERGVRLAEQFPALGQPVLEAKPTVGQVARSICGPLLRPVWAWAKWSLLALVVIFALHKIGLLDEWTAAVLMPTFLVAIAFLVLGVRL
jgi:hypothetical protein